jgi:nucleotide-binding universal stress UspA family protein
VAELAERGVSPGVRAAEAAPPSASLARAVTAEEPDLVVIGCRGYDAIYATLLGSTAEAVLRDCPAPVLAVKARVCRNSFATSLLASA